MKGTATLAHFRVNLPALPAFHLQMTLTSVGILTFCIAAGDLLTSIRIQDVASISATLAMIVAAVLLVPLYWHEKGKIELRDAALTIPWGLLLTALLPLPVAVAAKLGMSIGLKDAYFAHMDGSLGVNIPGIMAWASRNWLGQAANWTYPLLIAMVPFSFLMTALTGKVKQAQQFLTSNVIAFAVGLTVFALLPAVGPWWGYHFAPSAGQAECQQSLLLLRTSGPHVLQPEGVVCFPSFHVFWAILCARTLWCFWPFRIPASLLSCLIVLSTMTTGWHYFVDVLAGCVLAVVAIAAAKALPT